MTQSFLSEMAGRCAGVGEGGWQLISPCFPGPWGAAPAGKVGVVRLGARGCCSEG